MRTAQLNEIEECGSLSEESELPDLRYIDSFSKEEILAKFPNFFKIDENLVKLKRIQKTFYETLMVLAVNLKEDKENY